MARQINPQDTTADVESVISTAEQVVIDRFTQVQEYAQGALDTAEGFLENLGQATDVSNFPMPFMASLGLPNMAYEFNIGDPPVEPDVTIDLPQFPEKPILETITLLTKIASTLEYDLAKGVTGLNPDVENSIWMRDQEREFIMKDEAKERIAAEWSKRCFDLPDGVLVAQLTQAEIDYRNKFLDRSRDIALKQAELAFQHSQFIIVQIIAMEQLLVNAAVEGNKLTIQKYSADLEAYRVQVQAAISKIDEIVKVYEAAGGVFRSKAEAQAAIASVDIKAAEVHINATISQMQLFLKQAEIVIQRARDIAQLRTAAAEAGGRIASALAAGALSAVSVQAHLSATGAASKSYTGSEQASESNIYQG